MRVGSIVAVFAVGFVAGCSGTPSTDADDAYVERDTPDELVGCPSTTATNAQHVAAGRAYRKTTTFGSFNFSNYFAVGTDESLGSSGNLRTRLYTIAPGVYSRRSSNCPSGGTGGATGAGGASAGGMTATGGMGTGGTTATGGMGTGGTTATGGMGTGGTTATGGTSAGGMTASGGTTSTGGSGTGGKATGGASSGGATGAGGSVTTVGEPRIPPVPASCPTLATGNVAVLGQQVQLWVGQKQTTRKGSVMFYWHGTGSNSGEAQLLGPAINEITSAGGVVASFTTSLGTGTNTGNNVWFTDDFKMADVILACATQQLNIDTHRIYTAGCSAGGLQAGSMAFSRSSYLAGAMPNSGGVITFFVNRFEDPSHIPSVITGHGGDSDNVGVSFADTSIAECNAVKNAGGIAVDCNHGGGHCQSPAALTASQWQFLKDHPFGVKPDPYAGGLPSSFPSYCTQF